MLIRSNPHSDSFIDEYLRGQRRELSDENRCAAMMDPKIATSVGWCYENLKNTWTGRNKKNLLLIERSDLVGHPQAILDKIYHFLGCPQIASWGDNSRL